MNPYITHPLTALLRFALAWCVCAVFSAPYAPWFAGVYVSAFYEGREAGQREHDIKRDDRDKSIKAQVWAWIEAEYWIGWTSSNLLEALAGAVPVLIAAKIGSML